MNIHNNCVNLTSNNDIVFWGNNSTHMIIHVQPVMWPPFVSYEEKIVKLNNSSILYYKWCGPLILMLNIFAKRMNAKYYNNKLLFNNTYLTYNFVLHSVRIYSHFKDANEYLLSLYKEDFNVFFPHIILLPISPIPTGEIYASSILRLSRYIGYVERSSILSKTMKCKSILRQLRTVRLTDLQIYSEL